MGGCYPEDGKYPIPYVGTKAYDADSDGDGILDGADDQDFDDVPNIMELSRNMAGDWPLARRLRTATRRYDPAAPAKTCVNPFNPCLPDQYSRPASATRQMSAPYAPYRRTGSRRSATSRAPDRDSRGPARCAGPRSF